MTIFAVIAPPNNTMLGPVIEAQFSGNFIKVWAGHWFVASSKTATEIANQLGISDGKSGSAIVIGVSSYWGRADQNVWEWLRTKLEAK